MPREQVGSLFRRSRLSHGQRVESAFWWGTFKDPANGRRVVRRLFTDKVESRRELDRLIRFAERRATGSIDRFEEHRLRLVAVHVTEY
ncbi:MAG TPA: hypothetical protein VNO52_18875, partial [Methylomirabilota bacterium]|nr:hypothetical protein [Methylomirabilota bacterium]